MNINEQIFGVMADGKCVKIYTISNENCSFSAIDYGCCLTSLIVPDKNGNKDDIIVGFPTFQGYISNWMCHGAIVGRFANRISNAKFSLNGQEYSLDKNGEKGSCIHSGYNSYVRKIWDSKSFQNENEAGVIFTRRSYDGEQGFPGNLDITVTYSLSKNNDFTIKTTAKTDKDTPVNIINHSYFNLKGIGKGSIDDLLVNIDSNSIVEVDKNNLPTGNIQNIKDTSLDFTTEKPFSSALKENKKGIDRCFVLNTNKQLTKVATIKDPTSGRTMTLSTNQDGVQVYTPFYEEPYWTKYGIPIFDFGAFCLETECYPDSPNQKNFPSCILKPDEEYESITNFSFNW